MKLGAANASLCFYKVNSMVLFVMYLYSVMVKFLVLVKLCKTTSETSCLGFFFYNKAGKIKMLF